MLEFIYLGFLIYCSVLLIKTLSSYVFNNLLFLVLYRNINKICSSHVSSNPENEWTLCKINSIERDCLIDTDKEYWELQIDDHDEDMATLLENPENILNSFRFNAMYDVLIENNKQIFIASYQSLIMILYIIYMFRFNTFSEFSLGFMCSLLIHFIDWIFNMMKLLQLRFFDRNIEFNTWSIITKPNKFSLRMMLIFPIITLGILTTIRANVYTRLYGEYMMDLRSEYLYLGQFIGLFVIQYMLNLCNYIYKNPMMLVMVISYSIFAGVFVMMYL